jgi:hypothetical protein
MKTNSNGEISDEALTDAYFEMFPWLGEHFKSTEITSVKFKPPTLKLLRVSGGMNKGALVSIYFFDLTGKLIGKGQIKTEVRTLPLRRFLVFGPRIKYVFYGYPESVFETIQRIDPNMEKIHFIIGLRSDYPNKTLHISCPPKGMAFAEVLAEEKKAAEKVVRRALEN